MRTIKGPNPRKITIMPNASSKAEQHLCCSLDSMNAAIQYSGHCIFACRFAHSLNSIVQIHGSKEVKNQHT